MRCKIFTITLSLSKAYHPKRIFSRWYSESLARTWRRLHCVLAIVRVRRQGGRRVVMLEYGLRHTWCEEVLLVAGLRRRRLRTTVLQCRQVHLRLRGLLACQLVDCWQLESARLSIKRIDAFQKASLRITLLLIVTRLVQFRGRDRFRFQILQVGHLQTDVLQIILVIVVVVMTIRIVQDRQWLAQVGTGRWVLAIELF